MQTLISIIIALIIFSLLVLIHEFGHFIVAKKCGVVVNEFSIGMGPRICSHVAKSGTRYSLKWLPFGGSCAMLGEDEDNEEEGSFNSKPLWARMAIVFAGPFFNFILAFLLAAVVIGFNGADPSYVTGVTENSAVAQAGLREGDIITKFNGSHISVGRELYLEEYLEPIDGKEISLTYSRVGKKHEISYVPDSAKKPMLGLSYAPSDGEMVITSITENSPIEKAGAQRGDKIIEINGTKIETGNQFMEYMDSVRGEDFENTAFEIVLKRNNTEIPITVKPQYITIYDMGFSYNMVREKQSFLGVLKYSLIETKYQIKAVVKSLKMLVTGHVSANEISGPVGIVDVIGDTYKETKSYGFSVTFFTMMNLAIMLSANLGVMNLLPIPALDGGRLFLYIIELIIRRPIPKDKEGMIHFIGFVLMMMLMVFLIFNDVRKIFF